MNKSRDMGFRAGVIVIHDHKILLMHRIKSEKEYYVFPGGTVEKGESAQSAAIRELFEETTIVGANAKLVYELQINNILLDNNLLGHKKELLFLCDYVSGTPELKEKSEEFQRSSSKNYYKPVWFPLDKVDQILLYPLEVRDQLKQDVRNGFRDKLFIVNFKDLRNA